MIQEVDRPRNWLVVYFRNGSKFHLHRACTACGPEGHQGMSLCGHIGEMHVAKLPERDHLCATCERAYEPFV